MVTVLHQSLGTVNNKYEFLFGVRKFMKLINFEQNNIVMETRTTHVSVLDAISSLFWLYVAQINEMPF